MSKISTTIYFVIPVQDEDAYIGRTLDSIRNQSFKGDIHVYICVNQPDSWWYREDKRGICERNRDLMDALRHMYQQDASIKIIDRSSPGLGWTSKKGGVGMARKVLMDSVLAHASDEDILISMDADTVFEKEWVSSLWNTFQVNPPIAAINSPYYHTLSGNENQDKAILHYELYLRTYMLNLLRIGSPYAFTALGSAIAVRAKACRAVGGFDQQRAGEDFYFLQKLVKYGCLALYNPCKVYPSSRVSDRVPFGTGPAVAAFMIEERNSYPIFHHSAFEAIEYTYRQIDALFEQDISTSFLDFIDLQFPKKDRWAKLRSNYNTLPMFRKAFHHHMDGLRLFQYIRNAQQAVHRSDEQCLADFIHCYYPNRSDLIDSMSLINIQEMPVDSLDALRNFLCQEEDEMRKQRDLLHALKKKSNFAR
ncbi:MAG: glycosyltransferase [Bacteroidales bacterium]|jgi:glycosyltransferase involved in cell wall biosynthesis|nr:glycosyltransferase [Bacteroidales bacterium]MDD3690637.1 glycosyltransferase [Bacteroidales bacterium]MDX9890433.1 glycosyltransferase [Bacteroidales bacterium]NLO41559.1 glycosyltransferase [Bacteroidales bacterium]